MSVKKAEYRGYKIKRSGMQGTWTLDRPDGIKVYLRETDTQKFETEQDFYEYVDLIEDLKESEEEIKETIKKKPKSLLKRLAK